MDMAIGSDHRGVELKAYLIEQISEVTWTDVGCSSTTYCDYPEFTIPVVRALLQGDVQAGVLLCGTGVGMAITANRFPGIYAALVWNEEIARLSKEHDMANVLVLPADYVEPEQAVAMINAWRKATFLGGRHHKRITMIDEVKP